MLNGDGEIEVARRTATAMMRIIYFFRNFAAMRMGNNRLSSLARGHTDSTRVQLLRYVVVGGVAFVVDWGLLALLTECAGLYYLVSATISFIAGLAMNYALSTTWVFGRGTMQNKWAEFAVFALIGIVGLVLNNVFLWLFTDVVGVHYLISKVVVAVVVMLWNFFARKFILFNRKNNDNGKQE